MDNPGGQRKPQRVKTAVLVPRGLRRQEAAAYIAISATMFDAWVAQGIMPSPKRVGGIVVWDRLLIDEAFDELPGGADGAQRDIWSAAAV